MPSRRYIIAQNYMAEAKGDLREVQFKSDTVSIDPAAYKPNIIAQDENGIWCLIAVEESLECRQIQLSIIASEASLVKQTQIARLIILDSSGKLRRNLELEFILDEIGARCIKRHRQQQPDKWSYWTVDEEVYMSERARASETIEGRQEMKKEKKKDRLKRKSKKERKRLEKPKRRRLSGSLFDAKKSD